MAEPSSSGSSPPTIRWTDVVELPLTEPELRHDLRQYTALDVAFYVVIVVVTFFIVYPSGTLRLPIYLVAYVAMLAGFGALFYWRNRVRVRNAGRDPYFDKARVGSDATRLYIEDFTGRTEVAWATMSPPELGTWRGRQFYCIPYRDGAGNSKLLRLTAARMAAVLAVPDHPLWNLPDALLGNLEREFRTRGVPLPGGAVVSGREP